MQLAAQDWSDVAFVLLLPLILVPVWFALVYAIERTILAGRPLTPFLKSFNVCGSIYLLGTVYVMSFTHLLHLSSGTVWLSIPAWTALFVASIAWWHRRRAKDQQKISISG